MDMEDLDSNFIAALFAAAILGAIFVIVPALALPIVLLVCAATCPDWRRRQMHHRCDDARMTAERQSEQAPKVTCKIKQSPSGTDFESVTRTSAGIARSGVSEMRNERREPLVISEVTR
jgi:hypothetical protein